MPRHKHADVIIEWANGATIQVKNNRGEWVDVTTYPSWDPNREYRVKPEPIRRYVAVGRMPAGVLYVTEGKTIPQVARLDVSPHDTLGSIICLELDPETGRLISATEVSDD